MKAWGDNDLFATRPTSPAVDDATRTAEPLQPPASAGDIQVTAATQTRDPARYQILGEHGRGGLGRVSRARDRELGRDVAIKELLSRSHLHEMRFMREALITARLEHPGIVPVHEAGKWPDGTPFYAMKLVSGRPLRDLIAERPTVEARIGLLHHVIAVADAIAYAHGRNIIHRDLKPSNIIVGDFGETVVIDWGLAKDLTIEESAILESSVPHLTPGSDLTATGSVLGTPAYMAPEQERGDRVDQRADVFAIGAMLWELCALQKVPPASLDQRHRLLRRAGIDSDLLAIIDKALHLDPDRRYPDAGALAADLKAFKAGVRIGARSYSLWAMLVHWARRHRTLALSVSCMAVLAAFGISAYVHNIAAERDLTHAALARSETAKNAVILEHAALLLRNDPTAALAALGDYHGPAAMRARQIAAEASGRGVARSTLNPHGDTVHLVVGRSDGSILSVGNDRKVLLTRNDAVTVLAQDLSVPIVAKYAAARQLLAYATREPAAMLLDVDTHRVSRISTARVYAFAFSDDGEHVATLDEHSDITIWNTTYPARVIYHQHLPDAGPMEFAGRDWLIVAQRAGYMALSLEGKPNFTLTVPSDAFSVSADRLAIGDQRGNVSLFRLPDFHPEGSVSACNEAVQDVSLLHRRPAVLFVCHEGAAGVADYQPALAIRTRFATQGIAFGPTASEDEHLVVFLSDANMAYIHDLDSGLTTQLEGSTFFSTVSAPTSRYPLILTGDTHGTIRTWQPPESGARVVLRARAGVLGAAISADGHVVAAGSRDGTVSVVQLQGRTSMSSSVHTSLIEGVRFIADRRFVTNGFDGRAVVWNADDLSVVRNFTEHHVRVEDVDFVKDKNQLISAGDDGRLLAWSPDGQDVTTLLTSAHPLTNVEVLATDGTAVAADANGAVWHVEGPGVATLLRPGDGDQVAVLRASPTGRFVAVGTGTGHVTLFESATWKVIASFAMSGAIHQAAFSRDDASLAIMSDRHDFRLFSMGPSVTERWADTDTFLNASDAAFSPDGRVLAIMSGDGATWFHLLADGAWKYVRDHRAPPTAGRFSSDGRLFVSSDDAGSIVVRDVPETLGYMRSEASASRGVVP